MTIQMGPKPWRNREKTFTKIQQVVLVVVVDN